MRIARRRWAPLMFVAAAAAAAAPATAAEFEPKSWEVGAYVVSVTYDNDSLIEDTLGWGVRGGYIGVPRHEAEFNFQQQSSEDARKGTDITIDITRWDLSYVYNLKVKKPESKLIPLLNFGVGVMSYDNGSDSDSSTTFRAGGGIRVMFNPHLALRFDASIWHFHGDSVIIPRDGWFVFDATLGVSFVFGGGGA